MRDRLAELYAKVKQNALGKEFTCTREKNMYVVDYLIANGVTVQEWISVKDRLPDKPMKCLVYAIGEDIGRFDIAYYGGYYDELSVLCGTVTHWMPLPQPPVDFSRMFENVSADDLRSYMEKTQPPKGE